MNRNRKDIIIESLTGISVLLIIFIIISILAITIKGGWPNLSWKFLVEFPKDGMTKGGIFPAIVGTALMTLIMGFFIGFIGQNMDKIFNGGVMKWGQPSILWASLTMALLTLPVVIVSVEEAIRTIPVEMREASLALGATKWQTIRRVVLPGSVTGTILAISRGAGEVAPILFTGAAYYLADLPHSLSDQFMSLGYHIYIMSTQSANVDATLPIQFATTLVLLLLTFSLNAVAVVLRYRIRKKAK